MSYNHIRVFYGKYLDQITTELLHVETGKCGQMSRSVEPGEPNIPTAESYTVALANLDPLGNERYPFTFWQDESRTVAEGATQELQIYFRVEVNDQTQFVGMLKKVTYSLWKATCTLQLGDVMELLRQENRGMLKSFEFTEMASPELDAPGVGYNDLPTLRDLEGNIVPHESMTWLLEATGYNSTQNPQPKFDALDRDGNQRFPFAHHFGWNDLDYTFPVSDNDGMILAEMIKPTWVQVAEFTVFTRARFWVIQKMNDAGTRFRQEFRVSVWHNVQEPAGGIIPRGRFLWDDQLITEATEGMEMIFHEPDLGFDNDVALNIAQMPAEEDFIFGVPYHEIGAEIQIDSSSYAYFNAVEKITSIINSEISKRHTSGEFAGSVTITSPAGSSGGAGEEAEAAAWCSQSPYEDETLRARVINTSDPSKDSYGAQFEALATDTPEEITIKLLASIDASDIRQYWNTFAASDPGFAYEGAGIRAKETGTKWNGYDLVVHTIDGGVPISGFFYDSPTSGGADGFVSSGIDLIIGGVVIATSAAIVADELEESVATKVFDAAVAAAPADYSFTRDGATVHATSSKGLVEQITLDVKETGVGFEASEITGQYQAFNTDRLLPLREHVFWSDLIMFGWAEANVIEALVAVAWQVSGFLFTNREGQICLHSRTFYEEFPNDINSPDFDAVQVLDKDWEPTSGPEYNRGFQSYQTSHFIDIIEITNVRSKDSRTIYSNKDGKIESPTLRNKKVKIGNYRISDLGVVSIDRTLRYSPDDEAWPRTETLEDFLPTPRIQLDNIARSLFFPSQGEQLNVFLPDFPALDSGGYIWDEDSNLWLVLAISIDPPSLTAQLSIEFKKILTDFAQSFKEGIDVGEAFTFAESVSDSYIEGVDVNEHYTEDVQPPET